MTGYLNRVSLTTVKVSGGIYSTLSQQENHVQICQLFTSLKILPVGQTCSYHDGDGIIVLLKKQNLVCFDLFFCCCMIFRELWKVDIFNFAVHNSLLTKMFF